MRQHRPSPFGVIFDMDGVLIDSADAHWRSWRRLADLSVKQLHALVAAP